MTGADDWGLMFGPPWAPIALKDRKNQAPQPVAPGDEESPEDEDE